MIYNILVPIDFSECSKNALKYSIRIAKAFDAKIYMVNAVHTHTPQPDMVGGSLIESIILDYDDHIKESFRELESQVLELKDVPHEADRFMALVTDAIVSEVYRKEIDLVVMGTHEVHSGFDHIFGSRATEVLDAVDVPTIIVPENYKEFKFDKIGFASDLSKINDVKNINFLNAFGSTFQTEILAFAIVKNPEQLTIKDQKLMSEIKKLLSGCNCSVRSVQAEGIVSAITDFTKVHELDLLAMMPKSRSFISKLFKKSITRQVVLEIQIPLLSLRQS